MNYLVIDRILVQSTQTDLSKYHYLRGLQYHKDAVVDILIGQNNKYLLLVKEYRKGSPIDPYAAGTPTG